jgi:hypothetical protein
MTKEDLELVKLLRRRLESQDNMDIQDIAVLESLVKLINFCELELHAKQVTQ